jgi:hypothetical protein
MNYLKDHLSRIVKLFDTKISVLFLMNISEIFIDLSLMVKYLLDIRHKVYSKP